MVNRNEMFPLFMVLILQSTMRYRVQYGQKNLLAN